jgi:hypothetical protein
VSARRGGSQRSLTPELALAAWGLPFNFLWELAQSPAYSDWGRGWSYLLRTRLHCTAGDGLILLGAFWATSLVVRDRAWIGGPRQGPLALFLGLGLAYTVWSEWLNVSIRSAWGYSTTMPSLFGIGVLPLAQWLVVPLFVVWIVRRRGGRRRGESYGHTQQQLD